MAFTVRDLRILLTMLTLVLASEEELSRDQIVDLMLQYGRQYPDIVTEENILRLLHTPIIELY
jgi:hypothetical protein